MMNVSKQDADQHKPSFMDRSRGFDHIDTLDQLHTWSGTEVDPLAKSNTPLLPRSLRNVTDGKKSKVMLIHDYEGSYLEYEACQGGIIEEEKYTCEYLQYIETFVYFSHKLVTIPPPTWTNTCHRNGVKVLGTFIVEPDTPHIERIFERQNGEFTLAKQLACIADVYGFDGWLINIEKSFPVFHWSSVSMEAFLAQLRSDMGPDRKLVWYDALITLNLVWYQNTLNYLNLSFALAAGALLTNYAWNPTLAKKAKDMAERSGLGVENLYFGIDAWAQNIHEGKRLRTTYPPKIGGGTGIGLGMQELAKLGINAGIFAPGWSFEHFQGQNHEVEQAVWLGTKLDGTLSCDCTPISLHLFAPYQEHPIVRYARTYPAGSTSFMHTEFRRVFRRETQPDENSGLYAHLSKQSILPVMRKVAFQHLEPLHPSSSIAELYAELEDHPPRCSFSVRTGSHSAALEQQQIFAKFHVLDLDICDVRPMEINVTYRKLGTTGITVKLALSESAEFEFTDTAQEILTTSKVIDGTVLRPLQRIDLIITGKLGDVQKLNKNFLEFTNLTIRPHSPIRPLAKITDLRIERRVYFDKEYHRLVWAISSDLGTISDGMPHSKTTGPFAFFRICMDGREIGEAYALEYGIICPETPEKVMSRDVEVEIVGVGFDGAVIAREKRLVSWSHSMDEDWIVIDHE